jgi:hypothetical protein
MLGFLEHLDRLDGEENCYDGQNLRPYRMRTRNTSEVRERMDFASLLAY